MKTSRKLINLAVPRLAGLYVAGPECIDISVPDSGKPDRPYFARAQGRGFSVRAESGVTEIEIYDEIGYWGITAKDFRSQLKSITGGIIRLKVNSPGGDVFDGIAMYNDLISHPARIEVEVTGLAASAASIIAMAGDTIALAENAFLMIHNAWVFAVGDKQALMETVDILNKIDGALAATYAARCGLKVDEITSLMDAETWLCAADAVDKGFADSTLDLQTVSAHFDLSSFHNVPEPLRASSADNDPTKRDCERALREAGASKSAATGMVASGYDAVFSRRDAAEDRCATIAALVRLNETMKTRT